MSEELWYPLLLELFSRYSNKPETRAFKMLLVLMKVKSNMKIGCGGIVQLELQQLIHEVFGLKEIKITSNENLTEIGTEEKETMAVKDGDNIVTFLFNNLELDSVRTKVTEARMRILRVKLFRYKQIAQAVGGVVTMQITYE